MEWLNQRFLNFMQWIRRQSQNLSLSLLALALPFAFCLAGLPRAVEAQNLSTKVGDATLDEFMAAFANAFAGPSTYIINVDPGENPTASFDLSTDIDVQRLPVFALTQNGPVLFYATIPVSPYGTALSSYFETNGVVGGSVLDLADWFSVLSAQSASNVVAALSQFFDGYVDSGFIDANRLFESLVDFCSQFQSETSGRTDLYFGPGSAFLPHDVDGNGAPEYGTWITGVSSGKPDSMIATYDWWTHEAVEAAAEDIKDSLESLPQALYIQEGWTNLLEAIRELTNGIPLTIGSRLQELEDANQSRKSETYAIQDEIDRQLTNSVNSVRESGETFSTSVSNRVSALYDDLQDIVSLFDEQNRSSIVNLIPTLETYKGVQIPTLSLDLDDDRFAYRGRFVTALRWCCLLCWYTCFVIAMWHFIRRAIHVAQHIIAE